MPGGTPQLRSENFSRIFSNLNNIYLLAKGEHKDSTLDNSADKDKSASPVISTEKENTASSTTDTTIAEKDKKQENKKSDSELVSKNTEAGDSKQSDPNLPSRFEQDTNISTEKSEIELEPSLKKKENKRQNLSLLILKNEKKDRKKIPMILI